MNTAAVAVGLVHREPNSRLFAAEGAADQSIAGGDPPQPMTVLCDVEMVRAGALRHRHKPMHFVYPSMGKSEAGAQKQPGAGHYKKQDHQEYDFNGGPDSAMSVRRLSASRRSAA